MLAACTASVSHPTKTAAEMQADIDMCTAEANRRYWMDSIAALYNAYDCLEAMGYRRDRSGFAAQVEEALGEGSAKRSGGTAAEPCRVPCQ